MADWLVRLTRFHHYHYPVLAVGLFAAAVVLGEPGAHELVLGPLAVDAYWATLAAAATLFVVSVTDTYDPADYGLDAEE